MIDEVEYEEIPAYLGEGILMGIMALWTNSALLAMIAVLMMTLSFYKEWREGRFGWDFGLTNEGVVDDQIREA